MGFREWTMKPQEYSRVIFGRSWKTIFINFVLWISIAAVKCTPGHTYNDGCNNCVCSDKGDGYACTLMLCEDNPIFCDSEYFDEC